jgi:hypothetical protein
MQSTQKIDFDLGAVSGNDEANRRMRISPVVAGTDLWRITRMAKTDSDGHLKIDGVLPGMKYAIQDSRVQGELNQNRDAKGMFDQSVELWPMAATQK